MSTTPLKILAAADLHIGRRPARLPVDAAPFSAAHAWHDLVEAALAHGVDVVLLAGDVIDRDNRYFEAYGPLEVGLRRLAEADVDTVMVAGNHDFDVLPRLLRQLEADRLQILGAGGTWQRQVVSRPGRPRLLIDGWSPARAHSTRSPLEGYEFSREAEALAIGVLHADLGATASAYAPVTVAALRALPLDAWLVGHRHRPAVHAESTEPLVLNPGSPQGLDPTETGPHGPWLLEAAPGGQLAAQQLPLARLRYENVTIDLTGVSAATEFRERTGAALHACVTALAEGDTVPRHVHLLPRLVGRTRLHAELWNLGAALASDWRLELPKLTATVGPAQLAAQPDLDLTALANDRDPPGVVARLLLELQEDTVSEMLKPLLAAAEARLDSVARHNNYAPLHPTTGLTDAERTAHARRHLQTQAQRLLAALVQQRQVAG